MNALRLPTDGFGYGPARLARVESELALRRALPVSVLLVTALLGTLALVQRFVPVAAAPAAPDRGFMHDITDIVPVTLLRPVSHPFAPQARNPGVPLPVPDVAAPIAEPDAAGVARTSDGGGPAGGSAAVDDGTDTGGGAATIDPPPGGYVYADELPRLVSSITPVYPDMARDAGVEGTVTLWALVDLDGHVKSVQVIHSIPLLDGAAGAALLRWRFTPALANGHPVRVWVAVPVRFTLH